MSDKIKKFVKNTLFGRKNTKKDKKKLIEPPQIHVASRRPTRSAFECEDVVDKFESQRNSFYHTHTRRTRKAAKSMACGEDLEEAASDSDEEIERRPKKKLAFSNTKKVYSIDGRFSPEEDLEKDFSRVSMRSKRSSLRTQEVDEKDRMIEQLKKELRSANQMISEHEFRYERKARKYENLKGKSQRLQENCVNQLALLRNSMVMPSYGQASFFPQVPMTPNYYNQPPTPQFLMPQPNQLRLDAQIPTPPSTDHSYMISPHVNVPMAVHESDVESVKNFRKMDTDGVLEGYGTEESYQEVRAKPKEKVREFKPSQIRSGRRSH